MSQRIVVVGGPWPERIGCEGVIVEPSAAEARRYPFAGRGPKEVLILLDDDPVVPRDGDVGEFGTTAEERKRWTCVIGKDEILELA